MKRRCLEYAVVRVKETLDKGRKVAVIGWEQFNHNELTARIAEDKNVIFAKTLHAMPLTVGCALATKFVSHAETGRHKGVLLKGTFSIGDIKLILRKAVPLTIPAACRDLQPEAKVQQVGGVFSPLTHEELLLEIEILLETFPTIQLQEEVMAREEVSGEIEGFAKRFREVAASHPEGWVSRIELGNVLRGVKLDVPIRRLLDEKCLIGITLKGKLRIGWYKAGPNLPSGEPEEKPAAEMTLLERAQAIIDSRPVVEKEVAELEGRLQVLRSQLEHLGRLAALLKQVEDEVTHIRLLC